MSLIGFPNEVLLQVADHCIRTDGVKNSIKMRAVCRRFDPVFREVAFRSFMHEARARYTGASHDDAAFPPDGPRMCYLKRAFILWQVEQLNRVDGMGRIPRLIKYTLTYLRMFGTFSDSDAGFECHFLHLLVAAAARCNTFYAICRLEDEHEDEAIGPEVLNGCMIAAVAVECIDVVKELISNGVDYIGQCSPFGNAMLLAAYMGHMGVLELFLGLAAVMAPNPAAWANLQPQVMLAAAVGRNEDALITAIAHCDAHGWENIDFDSITQLALLAYRFGCWEILLHHRLPEDAPIMLTAGGLATAESALRESQFWSTMVRIAGMICRNDVLVEVLALGHMHMTDRALALALDEAARGNHLETVRKLVRCYPTATMQGRLSYSGALFWAGRNANHAMVDCLLDDIERAGQPSHGGGALALAGAVSGAVAVAGCPRDHRRRRDGDDGRAYPRMIHHMLVRFGGHQARPPPKVWDDLVASAGPFRAALGLMCRRPELYWTGSIYSLPPPLPGDERMALRPDGRGDFEQALVGLEEACAAGDLDLVHDVVEQLKRWRAIGPFNGPSLFAPAFAAASRHDRLAVLAYLWECFPLTSLAPIAREARCTATYQFLLDRGWNDGRARDFRILPFLLADVDERDVGLMPLHAPVPDQERRQQLAGTVALWLRYVKGRPNADVLGFLRDIRDKVEAIINEKDRWMLCGAFP